MSRTSQNESALEARTGQCGVQPEGPPASRTLKRYGVAIGIAVAALVMGERVWSIQSRHAHGYQASFEAGHMPVCDSGAVRQLLERTLDESPAAKDGFKVLKLGSFVDISSRNADQPADPNPPTRTCLGEVFSNRGHLQVRSELSWTDGDKDELYLGVVDVGEE